MKPVLDETFEINAPQDVVWEVLTDLPAYPQWNPFVVSCKTSLEPGEPIDMQVVLFSKPQRQVETIFEVVPKSKITYGLKGFAISSHRAHELSSLGATKTSYRSHITIYGWLSPLVLAIMRGRVIHGIHGMGVGVKSRAEELWNERQGKSRNQTF